MKEPEWKIPDRLQPQPERYDFDLEDALRAVVAIKTTVPSDAFTAPLLGTERAGNGVLISKKGLVLTIGYLVTEAETVWMTTAAGVVQGHVLAIDQPTGFALVQALGRLDLPALELGDSSTIEAGTEALFAGAGGRTHSVKVEVIGRRPFAGYWEYLVDRPFFTGPAHPFWGGGALIGQDGKLLGVGSLVVQQSTPEGEQVDLNMVVPVELLTPILDDLLRQGRSSMPPRPWLGVYCAENEGHVFVQRLSPGGPADKAGIRVGDRIVAVGDVEVGDLISLWRSIWARGTAGTVIPLRLSRARAMIDAAVTSSDRTRFFKGPKLH
ncbi:MAG TPA: S1C family serine protease [Magnetospirillaceae bacterium]|jgi:S1-C subfamily serine protease